MSKDNKTTGKVIITCAVTGAIHTPSMSPHLSVSPEEIITDSLAAAEAGAAILHLHARHTDGRPDQSPEGLQNFCHTSSRARMPWSSSPPVAAPI